MLRGLGFTWRHWQTTRLQPPFFSTGFPHLGQGLVLAAIQLRVSLSSWIFCFHLDHLQACAPMSHPHRKVWKDDPHRYLPLGVWTTFFIAYMLLDRHGCTRLLLCKTIVRQPQTSVPQVCLPVCS